MREEIMQSGGFVWVTKGREIENYLPIQSVHEFIAEKHAGAVIAGEGQYDDVMTATRRGKAEPIALDKIKLSKKVAEQESDFSILDLDSQMTKLVQFIQKANENT